MARRRRARISSRRWKTVLGIDLSSNSACGTARRARQRSLSGSNMTGDTTTVHLSQAGRARLPPASRTSSRCRFRCGLRCMTAESAKHDGEHFVLRRTKLNKALAFLDIPRRRYYRSIAASPRRWRSSGTCRKPIWCSSPRMMTIRSLATKRCRICHCRPSQVSAVAGDLDDAAKQAGEEAITGAVARNSG